MVRSGNDKGKNSSGWAGTVAVCCMRNTVPALPRSSDRVLSGMSRKVQGAESSSQGIHVPVSAVRGHVHGIVVGAWLPTTVVSGLHHGGGSGQDETCRRQASWDTGVHRPLLRSEHQALWLESGRVASDGRRSGQPVQDLRRPADAWHWSSNAAAPHRSRSPHRQEPGVVVQQLQPRDGVVQG